MSAQRLELPLCAMVGEFQVLRRGGGVWTKWWDAGYGLRGLLGIFLQVWGGEGLGLGLAQGWAFAGSGGKLESV